MTLVTGVVYGLPHQLQRGGLTVRAVTAAAFHLALEKRVRECLQGFAALQLMAAKANLWLRGGLQHVVACRVADMAIGTGDIVTVMRAGVPSRSDIARVAAEAHLILHLLGGRRVRAEANNWRSFLSAANPSGVCITGTVTRFALQLPVSEWAALIVGVAVRRAEYGECDSVVVTSDAGIGAFPAVACTGCSIVLCHGR